MKSLFGIIFLIVGFILSLGLLLQSPKIFIQILNLFENKNGYQFGYSIGTFIFFLFYLILIIVLFKFGLKWIKNKK